MHFKKLKFIIATSLTAIMIGLPIGESVYASENNVSVNNEASIEQAQEELENIEVTDDLVKDIKIIDSSTDFINGNYVLDEEVALQSGLSHNRIKSVKSSYNEINDSINKGMIKVSKDGSEVISNNSSVRAGARAADKIIFSKKLSAKACNDIAALCATGAGVAALAAGIAGIIPGINLLVVPILTIVAGILGIGSGAFWYAGNHGGVTFKVYRSGKVRI